MSQKLPLNNSEWIEGTWFNEDFIRNYNEESDKWYFLEIDVQHTEKLHELHDLPFLIGRRKIENVEKLVSNLHDKIEYANHIRNLKQTLNHG